MKSQYTKFQVVWSNRNAKMAQIIKNINIKGTYPKNDQNHEKCYKTEQNARADPNFGHNLDKCL